VRNLRGELGRTLCSGVLKEKFEGEKRGGGGNDLDQNSVLLVASQNVGSFGGGMERGWNLPTEEKR